jgi:hypothetical protein
MAAWPWSMTDPIGSCSSLTCTRFLDAAQERQEQLSELLGTDPATQPVGWPQYGELISHLDRLRTELRAGSALS